MKRKRPEDKSAVWYPRRDTKLYLEDLDEIFSVLRGLPGEVEAESNDFDDIRGVEELATLQVQSMPRLQISGGDIERHILVNLSEDRSQWGERTAIRISKGDDNDLYGAWLRVQEILTARELRRLSLSRPAYLLRVSGILSGSLIAVAGFLLDFISIFLAGVMTLAWGVMSFASPGRPVPCAIIIPKFRAEAPSFWEQHGTAVIISLVTNIAVAIVFFLIGLAVD